MADLQLRRCSCGVMHQGQNARVLSSAVSRCVKYHFRDAHWNLGDNVTVGNSLFVILSHTGNETAHRETRRQLIEAGVPEFRIDIVYGKLLGRDYNPSHLIDRTQIVSIGFLEKWVPRVGELLHAFTSTNAVWWFEADADLGSNTIRDLLECIAEAPKSKSILRIGYNNPFYGSGATAIVFRGAGLREVRASLLKREKHTHWDLWLHKSFKGKEWFPKCCVVGWRKHYSHIYGQGKRVIRPAKKAQSWKTFKAKRG